MAGPWAWLPTASSCPRAIGPGAPAPSIFTAATSGEVTICGGQGTCGSQARVPARRVNGAALHLPVTRTGACSILIRCPLPGPVPGAESTCWPESPSGQWLMRLEESWLRAEGSGLDQQSQGRKRSITDARKAASIPEDSPAPCGPCSRVRLGCPPGSW